MTLKVSTGLRNAMLATSSLKAALNLGFIKIYTGTVPATADAALDGTNTLLTTISNGSTATGLTLDVASGGVLPKTPAEVWSGLNANSGTASFYRHVAPGDDGTASTTQARLQGTVATAGAELNLTNPTLTSGQTQGIDYYSIVDPTL
jgi:hypothetical protein